MNIGVNLLCHAKAMLSLDVVFLNIFNVIDYITTNANQCTGN